MMKAIDRVTAHYRANKTQHFDVPEWAGDDGSPLRIHWDLMTLATRKKAMTGENDAEFIAAVAKNGDGTRMFDLEDALKLRDQADAAILTRIAVRMLQGAVITEPKVEQAEKN